MVHVKLLNYEIESLNNEFKRILVDEGHFTEANYPLQSNQTSQH